MTDLYLYKDKDSLIISGIDKCPEDEPRMARNVDDIHLLTADSPQDAICYKVDNVLSHVVDPCQVEYRYCIQVI